MFFVYNKNVPITNRHQRQTIKLPWLKQGNKVHLSFRLKTTRTNELSMEDITNEVDSVRQRRYEKGEQIL